MKRHAAERGGGLARHKVTHQLAGRLVTGAASVEGDHRPTAGHGFDGQDAEILRTRKQERAAAAQMIGKDLKRLMSKKLDGRAGNGP